MKIKFASIPLLLLIATGAQAQAIYFRASPGLLQVSGSPTPSLPSVPPATEVPTIPETPPLPELPTQPEPPEEPVEATPPMYETFFPSGLVVETGTVQQMPLRASNASGAVVYSMDGNPSWITYDRNGIVIIAPPKGMRAMQRVYFIATNAQGLSASNYIRITPRDTISPTWYTSAFQTATAGSLFEVALRADDVGSDVTITRVSGDSWIHYDADRRIIYGIPPTPGEFSVTLRASDITSNASDLTIKVTALPPPV